VALFAVRAQLPLMNIGVAVLATLADVCEHHFYVARSASYSSMHAAQRIMRLTVIELRNRADWPPAICGMAILAGKRQLAMRTMSALGSLGSCPSRESGKCKNDEEKKFRCYPSAHELHLAFVL
jgi:hypothetical protein